MLQHFEKTLKLRTLSIIARAMSTEPWSIVHEWKELFLPDDVQLKVGRYYGMIEGLSREKHLLLENEQGRNVFFVDGAFRRHENGRRDSGCAYFCGPNMYDAWADNADRPTNNTAELGAILGALKSANGFPIEIRTDSKYAFEALTKHHYKWRQNGWINCESKPVANQQLIEKCLRWIEHKDVQLKWIPRNQNTIAHRMARRARDGMYETEYYGMEC